jgi:hypothetical protein
LLGVSLGFFSLGLGPIDQLDKRHRRVVAELQQESADRTDERRKSGQCSAMHC